MRVEFHQTAGFDSQLPGWLSSFLDVYPSAALGFVSQATKKAFVSAFLVFANFNFFVFSYHR